MLTEVKRSEIQKKNDIVFVTGLRAYIEIRDLKLNVS